MAQQSNQSLPKAFVIGPIGDKDADASSEARRAYEEAIQVFEEVIAPACAAFGFEAIRADMIARTGEIPDQIFRHLRDSPVVIADLTGANPNVMYELGLRHTTGKVTIQLGERERLPFDVAAIRTIMFKRTEAGLVQARKDLAKSLAANVDAGGDPVTATRIWFEAAAMQPQAELDEKSGRASDAEIDEGPGFLEVLAEMETGIQSLVQTMAAAVAITQEITKIYAAATDGVNQSDAEGGGAAARLAIANRTAKDLEGQCSTLEVVSGEFEQTVERIEPGIRYVFERLANEPDQLSQLPQFPSQIAAMADAAEGSIGSVERMRSNILEMGKAARSLKRVGQRLDYSLNKFSASSLRIANWKSLIPPSAGSY